jgi:hypothetical protein
VTSDDDKRDALRKLEVYRASQPSEGGKVVAIRQDAGSK